MAQSHAVTLEARASRWPGVLGVVGILLGVLTIVDKASDLVMLLVWSQADWGRVLPPEMARLAVNVTPPKSWIALSSLIWIALSALLLRGSLQLYRRQRRAVVRLRLWAWLALGWMAVEWSVGLWWFSTITAELSAVAPAGWQATAVPAALFILAMMLAYPVFLIVWLARPAVGHEHAGWPG